MRPSYFELSRTFIPHDESDSGEDAVWKSYIAEHFSSDVLNWAKLLKSPVAVILGEEGTGKTWEIEAQAEKLKAAGSAAFFLTVASLAAQKFNLDTENDFQRWLAAKVPAVFFLDSVDEARLASNSALQDALSFLCGKLGTNLPRTTVCITCRVSEWRPEADLYALKQSLSPIEAAHGQPDKDTPVYRIVRFASLTNQQILALMAFFGAAEKEAIAQALDKDDLWDLYRRPKDVHDLAAYWVQNKRFGTRTEMLDASIETKLRESSDRHFVDPLDPQKALDGAMTLGAAVVLCREFSILTFSEDMPPARPTDGIKPAEALPDWKPAEIRALLSRGIFDPATFGKIRFHHRSVAERLAMKWLISLPDADGEIMGLLFASTRGREILRPAYQAIASALATTPSLLQERVRAKLLEVRPELFLESGEPQLLSVDVRRRILRSVRVRFENRPRLRVSANDISLRLFAEPGFADDVSTYLTDSTAPLEFRELLLRLVWHGRMLECAEAALSIAIDQTADLELRRYAILALSTSGDALQLSRLTNAYLSANEIDETTLRYLCQTVYPEGASAIELIGLLEKLDTPPKQFSTGLTRALEELIKENAPSDHLTVLCARLYHLVGLSPVITENGQPTKSSSRHSWLGNLLSQTVKKMLTTLTSSPIEDELLADTLVWLAEYRRHNSSDDLEIFSLQTASVLRPNVRRTFVAKQIALLGHKDDPRVATWSVFDRHDVLRAAESDLDWLLEDMLSSNDLYLAELYLHLAIWSARSGSNSRSNMRKIRQSTTHSPRLRNLFISENPGPIKLLYYRIQNQHRNRRYHYQIQQWRRNAIRKYWKLRNWCWLHRHIGQLASGKATPALAMLSTTHPDNDSFDENSTYEIFVPAYGSKVARAIKQGWIRAWRNYQPKLPHERSANSIDGQVRLGLKGIQAEITDGLQLSTLSSQDAATATRYALNENGFPVWFKSLVASHPQVVTEVFTPCIEADWLTPAEATHFHGTVSVLKYQSPEINTVFVEQIFSKLRAHEPANDVVLSNALDILLQSKSDIELQLTCLAVARIKGLPISTERFLVWMLAWLDIDVQGALNFLVPLCNASGREADSVVVSISAALIGDRQVRGVLRSKSPTYFGAAGLRQLIPLVYRHVRPDEDIRRGPGPFTSTVRDDAERARSLLLERLSSSEEAGAYETLAELVDLPELAGSREWILNLLDKRAEIDADDTPWETKDIPTFRAQHEVTPRSAQALFDLVLRRLKNIKHAVESDDFSIRAELRQNDVEKKLQLWLANRLRAQSRQWYQVKHDVLSVIREKEVDGGKKPDVSIDAIGFSVPVEIKWAESWSRMDLEIALSNQLVHQYMKAETSRRGILFIASITPGRTWKAEDGSSMGFSELAAYLRQMAIGILVKRKDLCGLEIVDIDFCSPQSKTP